MRLATSGATRWLIAPLSARDTVEGCTPHFSATSLIVGRDEAAGFVAFPVTISLLCTIHGIPSSRETGNRPDSSLTATLNIPKSLIAIDCIRHKSVIPMNVSNALSPHLIRPEHLDPNWRWDRAIPSHGHMSVDFERRIDFDRLRHYRLARARAALKASPCGALLLFDVNNIRYVTGTKIGEWEREKLCRFALLAGDGQPIVWDFGSAAVHHRINCDWLGPGNCRAGRLGL